VAFDVFVSYKREERAIAERVVGHLRAAGRTAVSDLNIARNEDFGDAIDRMIRNARATVVLWTRASAASDWVRKEARLARDLEKAKKGNVYIGVIVEPLDLMLAVDLAYDQMLDLSAGGLDDTGLEQISAAVREAIGPEQTLAPALAAVQSQDIERDLNLYQLVVGLDTTEAYAQYLQLFPSGTHAKDVTARLTQARRWYLHPLRRKNLSHTVAVAAVALTAATFALDRLGPTEAIVGITPEKHAEVEAERDAALAAAKFKAGTDAAAYASLKETVAGKDRQIESLERDHAATKRELEAELAKAKGSGEVAEDAPPPDCTIDGKDGYSFAGTCVALTETAAFLGGDQSLTDISKLKFLPAINVVDVSFTGVSDLSPITALKGLGYLDVSSSNVTNISVLAELPHLGLVALSKTKIASLTPLANKTRMFSLDLKDTKITDLSELKTCRELRFLYLGGTRLESLDFLRTCPRLEELQTPDGQTHKGRDAVLAAIAGWKP
jgi:hypothetical protein